VGGSEEQILVDIERRLLFADKEKGGENAGWTGQHLLRGRVIAKGQTTVRGGSERSGRAGIFSGELMEGKAKPEPTSHSFDGLKYVG
jgi:hypothetical protein